MRITKKQIVYLLLVILIIGGAIFINSRPIIDHFLRMKYIGEIREVDENWFDANEHMKLTDAPIY